MIHCIVNLYDQRMRIVVADLDGLYITFKQFRDDHEIRRYLRELSQGECDHQGRMREWSRETTEAGYADLQRLRTVVLRHVPLRRPHVTMMRGDSYFYLTRGNVQLSICAHSHRRENNEFRWFEGLLGDVREAHDDSLTSIEKFGILEDQISSGCDYDSCYMVELDYPPLVKRILEGSVLA